MLLLVLYRSFQTSGRDAAHDVLALSAVTIGLWITGTELNISSMMGMTMIVGIATEVAIFYRVGARHPARGPAPHEALIRAGVIACGRSP